MNITIENKLINRSMRSDNLSKFHQHRDASLDLAINIILPVCSNKTDALLQGQRNDGTTEEIAPTFKFVASKHAWCFSETTQPTYRRVPHWSYFNSCPRQWSQGIRVIKTRFWWTGGALLFLTLLSWWQQPVSHTADSKSGLWHNPLTWLPIALRIRPKPSNLVYKTLPPGTTVLLTYLRAPPVPPGQGTLWSLTPP